MNLKAGEPIRDIQLDRVFIGSCTNARIEDLRAAAAVVRGYHVAKRVGAMVVPGSSLVKQQAELEGLDRVFQDAGFEVREAGCSMCLAMNPDKLSPGDSPCLDQQSEFRRPPGQGRPHASGFARHGRSRRRDRAFCGYSRVGV